MIDGYLWRAAETRLHAVVSALSLLPGIGLALAAHGGPALPRAAYALTCACSFFHEANSAFGWVAYRDSILLDLAGQALCGVVTCWSMAPHNLLMTFACAMCALFCVRQPQDGALFYCGFLFNGLMIVLAAPWAWQRWLAGFGCWILGWHEPHLHSVWHLACHWAMLRVWFPL